MVPFWAVALFGFLIVARATRFLNSDYLAADFRSWIYEKYGDGKLWYLITCPWCASIWIAGPVAGVSAFVELDGFSAWAGFLGLWAGYSWVYGLVASNLDEDE